MQYQALGFVELPHLCDAIEVLDVMLKSATVTLATWEKKLGGRLVTIVVTGSVSNVTAAVNAACSSEQGTIVASAVIANPHEETIKMVRHSANKYKW